jgi:2-polyprenyl-6-methoxyphenol hydroxylase-like FAD-dependent oxidoreductase
MVLVGDAACAHPMTGRGFGTFLDDATALSAASTRPTGAESRTR